MDAVPTPAQLVLPLGLIISAFLAGIILEKIVFAKLVRVAGKTKWRGDDVVIKALRTPFVVWFVIAGVYGALLVLPLSQRSARLAGDLLLVTLILSVTFVLARLAGGFINLYGEKTEGVLPSTSIFANITKILIFVLGTLVILQSLGVSITPMLTALGVGGLAVALALQDTLSNLFAGLHILASRQIRPGDYIELDSGERGYVVDISWRTTTIRRLPNNMVVVPNTRLASAIVTNYSLPEKEMGVRVHVGIAYESDLAAAESVTIEVAKEVLSELEGGISEFEPYIRYHTFSDSSINFTVIMRAREFVDQYLIKHEFVKRLHQRYREVGIEIPFPIRTVHIKQEKA